MYFFVYIYIYIYTIERGREEERERGKERAISSDHRYMEIDGLLVGVKCGVRSVSLGVGDLVRGCLHSGGG